MAIKLASDDEDFPETHDINVTPFIDVVLVLLIIFMVAAPLSTVDSNIDLPASNAARQTPPQEPVYVTLNKDLSLQIDDMRVDRSALGAMLNLKTNGDKDRRIFLRADKSASYGDLMNVMNLLRDGGYLKIGLIGLEVGGGAMK